ncbi:MAG: hypothetical protein CTY38_01005 [Methylotenera sp.]|uniref:SLOG domain-containing protein n=1 Tax=Methylotenera sp. TaxID=2051956 RepID=UPI000D468B29|nr:hypothetical protein [Methylotenera sp.]PPC84657.1 MAG: hypothetical protein CTY38_01005 [Methylotenera sp.]
MATILVSAGPGVDNLKKTLPKVNGFLVSNAIRELFAQIQRTGHRVVFGEHPAVTVMVPALAESLAINPSQYEIYGAEHHRDNNFATKLVKNGVSALETDTNIILSMLNDEEFDAQIIIGGGDTVALEAAFFNDHYPDKPVLAIGSTGGYASSLNQDRSINLHLVISQFMEKISEIDTERKIQLSLDIHPVSAEPEDYGNYSVLVPNINGGVNLKEAVFAHPQDSVRHGWFYQDGNGEFTPVRQMFGWINTQGIEPPAELNLNQPKLPKL